MVESHEIAEKQILEENEKEIEEIVEEVAAPLESEGDEEILETRTKVNKKYIRGFAVSNKCSLGKVGAQFGSEAFTELERENMRNSCFRYFLDLQTNQIHMISSVVSQIVKARIKPGKLKYQIGGKELQFKPLDVTLTLGLKIGPIPRDFLFMEKGVPTAFRKKYFEKNKSITEKKILNAIKLAREDPTSENDIHRLNRILLLATCLIPDTSLTIDVRYVDLASNIENFDAFPWGTVVFELLEKSLDAAATNEINGKFDYGMSGCVLAFIIWAYSHLPSLGPRKLEDAPNFPRMLGWKNLPGKTTGRETIQRKLYPPRGKQIEVAPPFMTPYEQNIPLVIEAKMYQEELDKKEVASLEWILKEFSKEIEEGFVAGVSKILKPEVLKGRRFTTKNNKHKTTTSTSKEVPMKKKNVTTNVPMKKRNVRTSLSQRTTRISSMAIPSRSEKSKEATSTSQRTSTSCLMAKRNTAPASTKVKSTPAVKGKADNTSTPPKGGQIDIVESDTPTVVYSPDLELVPISLGEVRGTRSQGKSGAEDEDFRVKKRKQPEEKNNETEGGNQKKVRPQKKLRIIKPPTRKQPQRDKKLEALEMSWRKKLASKNKKASEKKTVSFEDTGIEFAITTKKWKVDQIVNGEEEKYLAENVDGEEEQDVAEDDEKDNRAVYDADKEKTQDVDMSGGEEGQNEAIDELSSLATTCGLLDSTMSNLQELPLLNCDYTGDTDKGEESDNGMDFTLYQEALKDYTVSNARFGQKEQGKKNAKHCDLQLAKIMGFSFVDRTTTNNQRAILNYYWDLKGKPDYDNTIVRDYGKGLDISVWQFHTLRDNNWIIGNVIEAYISLLIRWYKTMRNRIDPEMQYAIVPTVYFATIVSSKDVYGNFKKLMKDKSFAALCPMERVSTGRLQLRKASRNVLSPLVHMQDQVTPFKSKGILIPTHVSGDHWILLNFSFSERKVRIYDSLGYKEPSQQQICLETMLPYLVYASDPNGSVVEIEFDWERKYVDCAQQTDGGSCGAYLIAYVDCILRGRSLLFNRKPTHLRKRIAIDLLECGVEPTKKGKGKKK